LDILAQAYAEAGDYDQARKYVKQCMASPDLPEPIYRMLENHLDLFEQHKAVRIETTD